MLNNIEMREANERLDKARKIEQAPPTIKSEGFFIGVDLGQSQDFTAIVIIERVKQTSLAGWIETYNDRVELNDPLHGKQPTYKDDIEYHVRQAERIRLGTSYNDVIAHIYARVMSLPPRDAKPLLAIDAGGVGNAIFDMLSEKGIQNVIAVTTTSGETVRRQGARWNVPKHELVSCLKGLFARGVIRIAEGLESLAQLIEELENFELKLSDSGRVQYKAASDGVHDDIVSALMLVAFFAYDYKPTPLAAPEEVPKRPGARWNFPRSSKRWPSL